jgi:hypothetical protein
MSIQATDPQGESPSERAVIHEIAGPPLTGVEAGSAIAMGVVSLLLAGSLPVLLGALAGEHRLMVARIGDTAMAEALAMGLAAAFCGAMLKASRLRLIGFAACAALTLIDLSMVAASGFGVLALRAAAGIPEGVLLWVVISMIARTETPERWAGVFLTASAVSQFGLAAVLTTVVVPRFHANGGFILAAVAVLCFAPIALLGRDRLAALPDGAQMGGTPPLRGWLALAGTLLFNAAASAVSIYIVPLAHQAHLSSGVAGVAITVSLAAQILGCALATAAAGRVHYFFVFVTTVLMILVCWTVCMFWPPAWLFVGVIMTAGFAVLFATPFLVPMAIEADPSRRAAVQIGGAQLFGAAVGPFLASRVVGEHHVHAAVVLGAGLLIAALSIFGGLHLTAQPDPAET